MLYDFIYAVSRAGNIAGKKGGNLPTAARVK
jgi:hypothetical protein